jgi:hypothetical protein
MDDARIPRADMERQPAIPGPEEPRWVVLVCTTERAYDLETGEEVTDIIDLFLYRTVDPKSGGHVDPEDPSTWADWATQRDCQRWVGDLIQEGLPIWGMPRSSAYSGFVADGELYLALTDREPLPISHDRYARVRP